MVMILTPYIDADVHSTAFMETRTVRKIILGLAFKFSVSAAYQAHFRSHVLSILRGVSCPRLTAG